MRCGYDTISRELGFLAGTLSIYRRANDEVNLDKTQLIWLVPWRIKQDNKHNFKIERGCFNMLGLYFGRDEHS